MSPELSVRQSPVASAPVARPAAADLSSGATRHLLPQGEKAEDAADVSASPSPLAGEGARRADEGYLSANSSPVASAPVAQPAAADPSSGAARHLLPQGEKAEDAADVSASPSPLAGEGARRADEGYLSANSSPVARAPVAQPAAADPSSGATRHLLPQGEKAEDAADVSASPSPPAGEGARRADEGYLSANSSPVASGPVAQPSAADPSSGAARHLLPQGEKAPARHREVSPRLRGFARRLRHVATPHEDVLWELLRNRRFVDFKFRRQVPIGTYIADFVCLPARLIVELDGGQHSESKTDATRDTWLRGQNFRILRIWNNELHDNRDGVMEAIWLALQEPLP